MSDENKKEITQEEAAEEAKKYSSKVTEDDVADMVSKEEKNERILRKCRILEEILG